MTKILVIEDERPLLEEIVDILSFEGFEAIGAENGLVGVQRALEHFPDLIICDIMMPELDGYGVLMELRSDPVTSMIPFVFLTAKTDRRAMRQGMELGADDYLTKPFTQPELLSAIYARLEKHEAAGREYRKQLDQLRGSLLHALPHQLRVAFAGILGYSELLMRDGQVMNGNEVVGLAESIHGAGEKLHRLVGNFLIYAQTETLKTDPKRLEAIRSLRLAHPRALVEHQAGQKARQVSREADLRLEVEDADVVRIAADDLRKIVQELMDNAFKFSESGTRVHVSAVVERGQYVLRISNEGRGMTPEQIANVDMYMQLERRLYERQGTGLGLVIAKRLAELHGGRLMIQSTPHQSTRIQVALLLG